MKKNLIKEKVEELIENISTEEEKAEKIFYFIRDKIIFDVCIGEFFESPERTLRKKRGSCVTKATLLFEMMKIAGIEARYHFVMLEKKGLEHVLHPFVYKLWPDRFIHTFPEIKLSSNWIECDATYDIDFHERLKTNNLNFGRDPEKRNIDINFSNKGIKSAQDFYTISDEGHGDDLSILKDYLRGISFLKRMLFPLGRYLCGKHAKKIRKL